MHDKNEKPLKKGDRVTIEAEVTDTHESETFCNVSLKIGEKGQEHGPYNVTSFVTANAKQTTLIEG